MIVMAKISGWIAKNVLLPLTPFFIVAIFRFIFQGWNMAILEPGLLSFSMAMLCLMITKSANKLIDPDEKDIVYNYFTVFMILF